jgi:hypothetical protein
VAVVDASGMAAFCDYDRDGWLDYTVASYMGGSLNDVPGTCLQENRNEENESVR